MKFLPTASILLLLKGAASSDCPPELSQTETLTTKNGESITLDYAIVLSPVSESLSLFCARVTRNSEGYIGFGISPTGKMSGAELVIGLPADDGTGTVMKYSAVGHSKPSAMDEQKQTLMSTSIMQEDGNTVMEFTKFMEEPGEHPILATGDNTFIYALGGNDFLSYHGSNKDSATVDFDTTRKPTSSSTTPAPSFGGIEVAETTGGKTLAPTGGNVRGDPVPTPNPTEANPTDADGDDGSTPASPTSDEAPTSSGDVEEEPAEEEDPAPDLSGAITTTKVGTVILGAGAAMAVWFGL
mmetsp:Transcript_18213/g.28497  ORF Transcript_18213/g.28497 Transcript_18213/m.28497 type:complete len:298 (-) Transcript_18213:128-1021(-)|eukprot:CAMPEP_0201608906 /NCGR_PEP_ID=MMETSP0492-20130828/9441_1 /ASSEMBLY_ACC=CAM_ASM_000837 /TAXON_ID=420259 /ORGANISM="Thalassiosira gravida, Strain GMp14c1" /LENGTH=297 /DNA_ID=CAMNT_0048073955 /DNA_START=96 /DNA_END=989 /DNA_ORIENTATION=-